MILTRGTSLAARFNLSEISSNGPSQFWHMTPYSLSFTQSAAKESPDAEKDIVVDIDMQAPDASGKLQPFFQATFDLGKHQASSTLVKAFPGQDSGPIRFPATASSNPGEALKVTASVVEHGQARDWMKASSDALRDQNNRNEILKPILDALKKVGS